MILFIEDLDGCSLPGLLTLSIITNIHASPSEGLKRKTVESALCKNLASLQPSDAYPSPPPLTPRVIVIVNTETPFALHNALQDLQRHRIFYHSPSARSFLLSPTAAEQRAACIQRLLSSYDNCLSEYTVRRLLAHSVAFSVRQLRTLFAHAYLLMLVCKYHAIPAEAVSPADVSKQQCFDAVAQFLAERAAGGWCVPCPCFIHSPVVPSIPDAVLLALLDKEKPSYSVVDVTRISDWCRALSRPEAEMAELEGMIKTLRERDETIRREDRANTASTEPVERRKGEAYVMKELPTATMEAAVEKEETPRAGGLMSPKFSRMMEAEALNTSSGSDYKREMERNAREEAERVKQNEKKNLEERERMRQEEERRQHSEEERRKAEYEAQKRKEEERQRKIEEKLAAQEAERNRKIEEQRRIREEAARRRQEELERREEERRRKEQEELEQREREREALAEKRRQRMQEEIAKKERQNQKEAAEQMKRFEEERRRIYEVSMGFDAGKYKASTAQLDEQKSAEQKAREADQKKREEAVKKAREQMLEKLQREKEQKEMEKRTYQRLAELRRPAPATNEEKKQRIEAMRETVEKNRDRLKALLALKDEVKEIVAIRRKREEEERKKKEEEERKKREEEERKRKEEEELERKKREAEEAAARKKKEEEAERRRIEAEKRKQELEKEKEEMRKKKAEKAKKMEERLLQDELMLLDCREKVILLKKMVKEIKAGKWGVCSQTGKQSVSKQARDCQETVNSTLREQRKDSLPVLLLRVLNHHSPALHPQLHARRQNRHHAILHLHLSQLPRLFLYSLQRRLLAQRTRPAAQYQLLASPLHPLQSVTHIDRSLHRELLRLTPRPHAHAQRQPHQRVRLARHLHTPTLLPRPHHARLLRGLLHLRRRPSQPRRVQAPRVRQQRLQQRPTTGIGECDELVVLVVEKERRGVGASELRVWKQHEGGVSQTRRRRRHGHHVTLTAQPRQWGHPTNSTSQARRNPHIFRFNSSFKHSGWN